MVHVPTVSAEQCCHTAIAVATIPARQLNDCDCQRVFVIELLRLAPLGRAMLTHHPASPAFRDAEFTTRMLNELASAGGPYQ